MLIDPVEAGEDRAERCLKDGGVECGCGYIMSYEEAAHAITTSPDPYATPLCPKCEDAFFNKESNR